MNIPFRKTVSLVFLIFLLPRIDLSAQDVAKNEGFFNITQFSYIKVNQATQSNVGSPPNELSNSNSNAMSLNTLFGYFVVPQRVAIGLGFGLDGYDRPTINTAPFYLDVRYYFKKSIVCIDRR